jgi:hypothetical protein
MAFSLMTEVMTHSRGGMTLCLIKLDKMTLSFMSLGIMPLIMIIHDITTFIIMTFGTTALGMTLK